MADLIGKWKSVFGFDDDDDYDVENEDQPMLEDSHVDEPALKHNQREDFSERVTKSKRTNSSSSMSICVHEPSEYDDSPKIVNDLRDNKAVVLNFEKLDIDIKREIFDFVSGAVYAIDGRIQKVNKDIFILAPRTIEISGVEEQLKNSGMFPW